MLIGNPGRIATYDLRNKLFRTDKISDLDNARRFRARRHLGPEVDYIKAYEDHRNSDVEQMLFWKGAPSDRLNKRVMGTLKGAGLRKAKKVIDSNGSLKHVWYLRLDRDRRE